MTIPILFDATLRAARAYRRKPDAFLQRQLEERALERVQALTIPPARIAVTGTPSPAFLNDLANLFPQAIIEQAVLQDEILTVQHQPQLLIDLGKAALMNDLPGFLIQIRQQLAPNGKFVSALYGGSTLPEVRTAMLTAETNLRGGAAPRLHPMLDLENAIALLQRTGFANPVADRETMNLTYTSIRSLARDLREAGLSNCLSAQSRNIAPRRLFADAEALWKKGAERAPASFEIITLTGWRRPD